MTPKILAVIPTLADDPSDTIKSLTKQTVKVSKILVAVGSWKLYQKLISNGIGIAEYFYVKPDFKDPIGKRIAVALNYLLSKVRLEEFEYLLRVDADTMLPNHFIEENLKAGADYVGKAGYAMLLKMDCFIKFFGGRFAEVGAEDSYIGLKLIKYGANVKPYVLPPILKMRNDIQISWKKYFDRGKEMYKIGYEPIHVVEVICHDIRKIFILLGYVMGWLSGLQKYDIANWVFKTQLKRLFYGKRQQILFG